MTIFNLLTPITYWLLIAMWTFILFFYIKRLRSEWYRGSILLLLFAILSIDAFRTLFESIYFGAWYTSLAGLLPIGIHDLLERPEFVIIPKLLNVFAAALIIVILIRNWIPREAEEIDQLKERVDQHTKELSETIEKLEGVISEKELAEEALHHSQEDLEKKVKDRTCELSRRTKELETFNRMMLDRELRVIELKEEVNKLCEELGRGKVYPPIWGEKGEGK